MSRRCGWTAAALLTTQRSTADFRKDSGPAIKQVCVHCVVLGRRLMGLSTNASVAIDGSKFKAVNTRDKNFTRGKVERRRAQLEKSVARYLAHGGAAADQFGRRQFFIIGISIFAAASLWCGIAPDLTQLISARAAQGAGAALLIPCSLAIIGATFDETERGKAIGTWAGSSAVATAIAPLLGGWIVDHFSWRWIFLINPLLALPTIWIAYRHVPESRDPEAKRRPRLARQLSLCCSGSGRPRLWADRGAEFRLAGSDRARLADWRRRCSLAGVGVRGAHRSSRADVAARSVSDRALSAP